MCTLLESLQSGKYTARVPKSDKGLKAHISSPPHKQEVIVDLCEIRNMEGMWKLPLITYQERQHTKSN